MENLIEGYFEPMITSTSAESEASKASPLLEDTEYLEERSRVIVSPNFSNPFLNRSVVLSKILVILN